MTEESAPRNVRNSTLKWLQAVFVAKRWSWGRRPHDQGFSEYRVRVKHIPKCPIVMFRKTSKFVNEVSNCPLVVTNNWHLVFYKVEASKASRSRNASNLYAVTEGSASRNVTNSTLKWRKAVVYAKRWSWGQRPHDQGFCEYRVCVKHAPKCPIVMFRKTSKFVNQVPSL